MATYTQTVHKPFVRPSRTYDYLYGESDDIANEKAVLWKKKVVLGTRTLLRCVIHKGNNLSCPELHHVLISNSQCVWILQPNPAGLTINIQHVFV